MSAMHFVFPDIYHYGMLVRFTQSALVVLSLAATHPKVFKGKRNRWAIEALSDLGYLREVGVRAYAITVTGRQAWTKIEQSRVTGTVK